MANILQIERDFLNKRTTNISTIIVHLFAKGILTTQEKENLKNRLIYPTSDDECDALYSLLERKHVDGDILKNIFLNTCNEHLVIHIWKDLTIKNSECFRFWNVPPKIEFFTGRVKFLDDLKMQCNLTETLEKRLENLTISTWKLVLEGMGGIGKSSLAIQFVYENKEKFKNIFWLDAEDVLNLKYQWIEIGFQLGIFSKEQVQTLQLGNYGNFEEMSKYLKKIWFEVETNFNWLIVLDKVENYEEIEDFFPNIGGHILVTSVNSTCWTKFSNLMNISCFELEESNEYINKLLENEFDKKSVNNLALEMDNYPLALYHSCVYINKLEISILDFIAIFNSCELQDLEDDGLKLLHETWKINLEKIFMQSEITHEWLQICGLLMPEKIPKLFILEFLKIKGEESEILKYLKIHEIVLKFGLSQWDPREETYSIHRIVQKIIRSTNKNEEKTDTILFTILQNSMRKHEDLKKSHIFHHAQNFLYRKMEGILKANNLEIEKIQNSNRHIVKLINSLTFYLGEMPGIEVKFSEYFEIVKKFLTKKSDLFVLWSTQGLCQYYQGHLAESKIFYEKSLEIIGLGNIVTITQIFHYLENICIQKKFQNGLENDQIDLQNSIKIEPKLDHRNSPSLLILFNIGLDYSEMGKYTEALQLFETNLEIVQSLDLQDAIILGEILRKIAWVYNHIGNYPKALENINSALDIQISHFGESSVHLLVTYIDLGNTLKNLGKLSEAFTNYKKSLDLAEKYHNQYEPELGSIYTRLAASYCEIEQFKSANEFCEKAFKIFEKNFGPNSTQSIDTLYTIAGIILKAPNQNRKALEYFKKALEIQEIHFGVNSTNCAKICQNIGSVLAEFGEFKEAAVYVERAIKLFEAKYGKDHLNLIESYNCLEIIKSKIF